MRPKFTVYDVLCPSYWGDYQTREQAADARLEMAEEAQADQDDYEVFALVDPQVIAQLLDYMGDDDNCVAQDIIGYFEEFAP